MALDRAEIEELIDRPDTPAEDIRETLRDQAWVNRWLGGAHATLAHVVPVLRQSGKACVKILDMACGGADITRRVVDAARRYDRQVKVTALDLNPKALHFAREFSAGYPEITFVHEDALNPPELGGPFDIVMQSTFLHHLNPEEAARSLRIAASLSRGRIIAADLVRSPLAYLGFKAVSRLARFNPVSLHDGAASVLKAYTPSELADIARGAGLRNWKIIRHRFYRMALVFDGEAGNG